MPEAVSIAPRSPIAMALVLLLLAAPVPAASGEWRGVVVDDEGRPVAGAFVRSHATGDATWTDARGLFALDARPEDDVLVVARAGFAEAVLFAPGGGASGLRAVLRPGHDEAGSTLLAEANASMEPALALAGQSRHSVLAAPVRVPFLVEPGTSSVEARLEWTPAQAQAYGDVLLDVEILLKPEGLSALRTRGPSPITIALPQAVVVHHPGEWEVVVRPADSLALRVDVHVEIWAEQGPLALKHVQGAPPQLRSPVASQVPTAPPTMDVLDVAIDNETEDGFEIRLGLAQVGTLEASRLAYAHWVVHWTYAGDRYFAAMSAHPREAQSVRGEALDFSAGDCDDVCRKKHSIVGAIEWGTPGAVRFTVPKDKVGSVADGMLLSDLGVLVYESADDLVVEASRSAGVLVVERAEGGSSYRFGAHEYDLPRDVREAALRGRPSSDPLQGGEQAALALVSAPAGAGGWMLGAGATAVLVVGASVVVAWRGKTRLPAPPGHYEAVRELGRGASSRVVLARQHALDRHVAIKEALGGDGAERARLLREARTLARLDHPNVVRIHNVEERPEGVAIVMEYVAGGSLQDRLDRGLGFSRVEAAEVWRDVLRGLAAIHQAGIVHRDLKPANVLLTTDGSAKLADFGVARDAAEETLHGDAPGGLFGTPLYMAPEQLRREPPTPASDVYSASAIAFELFTGRRLVDAAGCRTTWDLLLAPRARPDDDPALDGTMRRLLSRALAEDPACRSADAGLLAIEVEEAISRLKATR